MLDQGRQAVNVLKKVKVNGKWKFCPTVIDSGGKLRDKVRVNGHTEVHPEGVYYIEWRRHGRRVRESVSSRHDVLEQARLKALELEGAKLTPEIIAPPRPEAIAAILPQSVAAQPFSPSPSPQPLATAAGAVLNGFESYLHSLIGGILQSHLGALGVTSAPAQSGTPTTLAVTPTPVAVHHPKLSPLPLRLRRDLKPASRPHRAASRKPSPKAVDSYLATVKPPQREQATYNEYKNVLETFWDTCKKTYLREVDRDDLLAFRAPAKYPGQQPISIRSPQLIHIIVPALANRHLPLPRPTQHT